MYFVTILQHYSIVESSKISLYYRGSPLLRLFFLRPIQVYSLVHIEPVLNTLQLSFIAKPRQFRSGSFARPSYQSSSIRQIHKSLLNKILKPLAFILGKMVTSFASKTGLQVLSLRTLLTLYVLLRPSKGSRILRILKVLRSKGSLGTVLLVFISQSQALSYSLTQQSRKSFRVLLNSVKERH